MNDVKHFKAQIERALQSPTIPPAVKERLHAKLNSTYVRMLENKLAAMEKAVGAKQSKMKPRNPSKGNNP